MTLSSRLFLRNASYNLPADVRNHPYQEFLRFQEKFNEGIYISESFLIICNSHAIPSPLRWARMVLAFVRLDIGEHPDAIISSNFWIIRAVAEQLGRYRAEWLRKSHLEYGRATWKRPEQTPIAVWLSPYLQRCDQNAVWRSGWSADVWCLTADIYWFWPLHGKTSREGCIPLSEDSLMTLFIVDVLFAHNVCDSYFSAFPFLRTEGLANDADAENTAMNWRWYVWTKTDVIWAEITENYVYWAWLYTTAFRLAPWLLWPQTGALHFASLADGHRWAALIWNLECLALGLRCALR